MRVNVVALITYKGINPQILAEIEDIYQEKEGVFKDFNNVLKNVFGISGRNEPYWFDEKLRTKVEEPDLTIPLRYSLIHSSSIRFRFGKNSIEVISEVRMSYFIQNKAIQSAMLTCFQEIGSRHYQNRKVRRKQIDLCRYFFERRWDSAPAHYETPWETPWWN